MISIIPARGGSKGLPGKNIKYLCGKPLIAYTIEAALNCSEINRVIVSTEDEEIAEIAKNYGAEVPFLRPMSLAGDETLAMDVFQYTIEKLESENLLGINSFIVLQPTSPLRSSADIYRAVNMFRQFNAIAVISFTKENHPIAWHKYLDPNNRIIPVPGLETRIDNRQNYQSTYYPNGAIYIYQSCVLKTREIFGDSTYAYLMPQWRSVDIDSLQDFLLAETIMQNSPLFQNNEL